MKVKELLKNYKGYYKASQSFDKYCNAGGKRLTKLQDNIYRVNEDATLYEIVQKLGVYEEAEQNRYELEISELNISPQTYKKLNKKI